MTTEGNTCFHDQIYGYLFLDYDTIVPGQLGFTLRSRVTTVTVVRLIVVN